MDIEKVKEQSLTLGSYDLTLTEIKALLDAAKAEGELRLVAWCYTYGFMRGTKHGQKHKTK